MRSRKGKKEEQLDPFEDGQPSGYHYSRKQRLSLPTAPRVQDRGGGIFRKNRTLLIILLDLVIILVLGLFLMRYLYAQVHRADLEGYSVVLRGFYFGEVVFATMTITNKRGGSVTGQRIYARLSLDRAFEEEDTTFSSAILPDEGEEQIILRVTIPAPEGATVLYAEVEIGDTAKRLSTGLER
jgi:hypothetical protein